VHGWLLAQGEGKGIGSGVFLRRIFLPRMVRGSFHRAGRGRAPEAWRSLCFRFTPPCERSPVHPVTSSEAKTPGSHGGFRWASKIPDFPLNKNLNRAGAAVAAGNRRGRSQGRGVRAIADGAGRALIFSRGASGTRREVPGRPSKAPLVKGGPPVISKIANAVTAPCRRGREKGWKGVFCGGFS
jgi:hypothetical protein